MTLIEDLLNLQVPKDDVRLSPNGQQVVYRTTFPAGNKTGDHEISTLWLAETGKQQSFRQITAGKFNDRRPRWCPDGKSIAFLSDRGKAGESCAIYTMPVHYAGEPMALTLTENQRSIDKFEFSTDGKTIAFISAEEKSGDKKKREKDKDDANVWGEDWAFNRLRLIDVESKEVTVLVSKKVHIIDFAWNDDGTKLAFAETKQPVLESLIQFGATLSTIDLESKKVQKLCHFPVVYDLQMTWSDSTLYFIAPRAEVVESSFRMVWKVSTDNGAEAEYEKHAHGETNCAIELHKCGSDVLVCVQEGMADEIRFLGGHTLFSKKKSLLAWHAAFTNDSDEVVLAIAQGDTNSPTEVYTTTASGGALVKLSDHGKPLADRKFGTCNFLTCPSSDGKVTLECPFLVPASASIDADGKSDKPLPTAVLTHGGPYSRTTERFDTMYFMWTPPLLAAGYAVLVVDYRGSSARGEDFASYARGVGKYDYEDIITCTDNAISKGYIDSDRVLVGGYSQGGFLSYICSVRNGTHDLGWSFKAAIPGAGVTDQDTMTFTSDIGRWQAELGSIRPWKSNDKSNTANRQGSAIWEFGSALEKGVTIPPMLILHGEQDKRVPIEQAVAMRRALEDADLPFEYVTYPREDHSMKERKHLMDMAERVKKWCDVYIGAKT